MTKHGYARLATSNVPPRLLLRVRLTSRCPNFLDGLELIPLEAAQRGIDE